jgi:hypothetical protein
MKTARSHRKTKRADKPLDHTPTFFHLPNHSWLMQAEVTPEMRNTPTRIVRDCGESVLARNSPLFAEQNNEPAQRTQEPNLKSPSENICYEAEYLFELLQFKAKSGDSTSAQELAYLAIEAVITLTEIAKTKPEILLPTSQEYNCWPVIKMKRQALTDEEKTLFTNLKIGEKSMIELDAATAKWKWDDAGKIADGLLFYIQRARTDQHIDFGRVGKKAKKLQDFNDESGPKWWDLAKSALLESYPEPEKVDELDRLVSAKSKRRSPGRIRQAILDILKARFLSFAKNTAYRT